MSFVESVLRAFTQDKFFRPRNFENQIGEIRELLFWIALSSSIFLLNFAISKNDSTLEITPTSLIYEPSTLLKISK